MKTPAVSIILPTFNRLEYLRLTVESIFAQTFDDWELIVADDGSNEETKAYLRVLEKTPRVRLLWLHHSGNPAAARNAALKVATGDYLAFQDSDDLWIPSKLEIQMSALRLRPACKWSYTRFGVIDAAGAAKNSSNPPRWKFPGGWILEKLLMMEAVIAPSTVVVCRRLVAKVGGFDEAQRMCNDYDLWLRLAMRSEVDVIDEPLVSKRRHDQHYGDDASCFEDLLEALEKTRLLDAERRLEPLINKARARAAAGLALSHANYGTRRALFDTLLQTMPHSWRYREWWSGAVMAVARSIAPTWALHAARVCKTSVRSVSRR